MCSLCSPRSRPAGARDVLKAAPKEVDGADSLTRAPWPRPLRSDGKKAVEEGSVASHRLPQVLCRDLVAAVPLRLESRALSRENLGKALHGLGDKLVGRLNGRPRLVYEAGLDLHPAPAELQRLLGREEGRRRLDLRRLRREVLLQPLFEALGRSGRRCRL